MRAGERCFAGTPSVATLASYADLAWSAAQRATEMGLRVTRICRSRAARGHSFYVRLTQHDQLWIIRISDHAARKTHCVPHFDLVSRDGVSGFSFIEAALHSICNGTATWFDPRKAGTALRFKRRGTPRNSYGRKIA